MDSSTDVIDWSSDDASETDDLIFNSAAMEIPHIVAKIEKQKEISFTFGNIVCHSLCWKFVIFVLTIFPLLFYAKTQIFPFDGDTEEIFVKFDDYKLRYQREYICMSYHLNRSVSYHIRKFSSANRRSKSRNILLFGCERPSFSHKVLFRCGTSFLDVTSSPKETLPRGPLCGPGKSQLIFAQNPTDMPFTLHKNASFHLGKGSSYNYLVIKVYYSISENVKNSLDSPGLRLDFIRSPTPLSMQLSLLSAGYGLIPSGQSEQQTSNVDVLCTFRTAIVNSSFTPVAYRTHAHSLGNIISGYYINRSNMSNWILLGRKSPQLSQIFYPIRREIKFRDRDRIAVRCNYNRSRDHDVTIGLSQDDEMCNMYIMYYTQTGNFIKKTCNNGWRYYYRLKNLKPFFKAAETLEDEEIEELNQYRKKLEEG